MTETKALADLLKAQQQQHEEQMTVMRAAQEAQAEQFRLALEAQAESTRQLYERLAGAPCAYYRQGRDLNEPDPLQA